MINLNQNFSLKKRKMTLDTLFEMNLIHTNIKVTGGKGQVGRNALKIYM